MIATNGYSHTHSHANRLPDVVVVPRWQWHAFVPTALMVVMVTYVCWSVVPQMRATTSRSEAAEARLAAAEERIKSLMRSDGELHIAREELIRQHTMLLRQQEKMTKRLAAYEGGDE